MFSCEKVNEPFANSPVFNCDVAAQAAKAAISRHSILIQKLVIGPRFSRALITSSIKAFGPFAGIGRKFSLAGHGRSGSKADAAGMGGKQT